MTRQQLILDYFKETNLEEKKSGEEEDLRPASVARRRLRCFNRSSNGLSNSTSLNCLSFCGSHLASPGSPLMPTAKVPLDPIFSRTVYSPNANRKTPLGRRLPMSRSLNSHAELQQAVLRQTICTNLQCAKQIYLLDSNRVGRSGRRDTNGNSIDLDVIESGDEKANPNDNSVLLSIRQRRNTQSSERRKFVAKVDTLPVPLKSVCLDCVSLERKGSWKPSGSQNLNCCQRRILTSGKFSSCFLNNDQLVAITSGDNNCGVSGGHKFSSQSSQFRRSVSDSVLTSQLQGLTLRTQFKVRK